MSDGVKTHRPYSPSDIRMLRVYVAGAYSADNVVDVLKNIGRGEYYAGLLFHKGFAPFCPWHDRTFVMQFHDRNPSVKMFYDYSIKWLEVSDAMFLVPGWENSGGTKAEMDIAEDLSIPIFKDLSELEKYSDGYWSNYCQDSKDSDHG